MSFIRIYIQCICFEKPQKSKSLINFQTLDKKIPRILYLKLNYIVNFGIKSKILKYDVYIRVFPL